MNHEGYQRRLDLIQEVLKSYGLESTSVTPLEYVETAPFHFNNFIYKIDLKEPLHEGSFNAVLPEGRRRPSVFITAPPPPSAGVKTVVFRLSNPLASGVNSTHRIENEVASLFLARQALAARSSSGELPPEYASIVPAVYAWSRRVEVDAPGNTKTITVSGGNDGSTNENASESVATPSAAVAAAATDDRPDERTFAWLIMEYRPGEPLDRHFGALPLADRVCIVRDVASVVAVLQHIGIPKTVREFGGINITADHYESTTAGDGNARLDMPFLASGQMAILPNCGPFATLAEFWQARLRCKLAEADKSPVLAGWVANGVRQRVEALIANGVPELLRRGLVNTERRVLVHGDLSANNMLFDPVTGQITGVLDFDFSYVGHPADEFLAYSFSDMGCSLGQASPALRHAILSGDFTFHGAGAESIKSNTTAGGKESQDDADTFAVASAFFTALADKGGYVPSNIAGMETLEALRDVEAMLAPFALSMLVMIERARAKGVDLDAKRAEAEEKLVEWLEGMGY